MTDVMDRCDVHKQQTASNRSRQATLGSGVERRFPRDAVYLLEKTTKRDGFHEYCNNPECGYKHKIADAAPATNAAS